MMVLMLSFNCHHKGHSAARCPLQALALESEIEEPNGTRQY